MWLAALAGAALAWLGYRGRLHETLARWAAFARLIAVTSLLLLLIDPGFTGRSFGARPVVLIDHSLSMSAGGGRGAEAAALAATLGDTIAFGELAPGLPGNGSRLADLLTATSASGRAMIVVTDGEIADSAMILPDVLARTTIHTLPRHSGADIALVAVRAPQRLAAGDTLTLEIEAVRTADAADSVQVEVREGSSVPLRGTVRFKGATRARLTLSRRITLNETKNSGDGRGEHWLEIALAGANDSEPGDDVRWLRIILTPTPGIVVLNSTPDWDGRSLYQTLKETASAPVTGYTQLQPGRWYRMGDLRPVGANDVAAAARAADLLAVRGDIGPWRTTGHARLLWAPAEEAGDWFVSGRPASPVGGAFLGVSDDSLAPALSAHAIDLNLSAGWIGAVARRSRRGLEVPIVGGQESAAGRTVWFGADGLYRWANRDGMSGQLWRNLVSSSVNWLLASRAIDSAVARPVGAVTQRGRAVRFRWLAATSPVTQEIRMDGPQGTAMDSLRFDGAGEAALALDVGRYRYQLAGGGTGSFAVEPFADELVPAAVTLASRASSVAPVSPRRSWRELWWLFALAVAGFGAEWMVRRRMGVP